MRSLLIFGMFAASFAAAGEPDYSEVREQSESASGASRLVIDTGSGSLTIVGVEGLDAVEATVTIGMDGVRDEEEARKIVDRNVKFTLERRGDEIELVTDLNDGLWGIGRESFMELEVRMPSGLDLYVDDGSCSMDIENVRSEVKVDDGSGSITIRGVGALEIDDGSGSIQVEDASGDVDIIDGSGSIKVTNVQGSVIVDDGSGSITVRDVTEDVRIEDAGSGSVNVANVAGSVETDG